MKTQLQEKVERPRMIGSKKRKDHGKHGCVLKCLKAVFVLFRFVSFLTRLILRAHR